MKTKTLKKNKVNVVTLGCSKNVFDSEVLMGQLKANNFEVEHDADSEDAAIVVINTCGFIDNAKEESINTILNAVEAKNNGFIEKVYVTGCLSERYKDDLRKDIPEVDEYFGTRDLGKLLKVLKADYKKELVGERLLSTPSHYAYFKIAEGCDRPCSFCAIPIMRGKHKSTPIETLVDSAQKLADKGVKELLLIAQDLTYYGIDIYGERKLADLLRKISDVKGIEWIRLHYAFPTGFPMEVLDVMNERDNVCNYLDMPLQHISTPVLKNMKRGTTFEKTNQLIKDIRAKVPGITLRTTLISGFPGETQEDFDLLHGWVKEQKFERLGIFTYSHEENTTAHLLEDNVPEEEKKRRADEIMDSQMSISYELNQSKIGKEFKVLIDRLEGGVYVGRTEFDSPEVDNEVVIGSDQKLAIGDFYKVLITSADHYDLQGKIV
jgi:ribosomal protein S12 methylthiotransferase